MTVYHSLIILVKMDTLLMTDLKVEATVFTIKQTRENTWRASADQEKSIKPSRSSCNRRKK